MSAQSPWPEVEFRPQDVRLFGSQDIRMQFAERVVPLADGVCFGELGCQTGDRWQTGFFSSDREMDLRAPAGNVMVEFSARDAEKLGMELIEAQVAWLTSTARRLIRWRRSRR